jgi:hypothetical protein
MTLTEAQNESVSGVAALGNETMQDVIWPKGSPHAFRFLVTGYFPFPDGRLSADCDDWHPVHRRGNPESSLWAKS